MLARTAVKWPFPRVVVHRGGGNLAPENTLFAIRTTQSHSIAAVEFDVMLSSDKIPMLMHDDELTRTVIDPALAGVMFSSLTAKELSVVDVGSYFKPTLSDCLIPTFEEVLKHCLANKVFMNIEIKPTPGFEMRTGIVVGELVMEYADRLKQAGVTPLFSSFSFEALKAAKEVAPAIPRGFLIHEPLGEVPNWQARVRELGAVSVNTNAEHLTYAQVQEISDLGCATFCYTVNDLAKADELLSWGVSCLCTDNTVGFRDLAFELAGKSQVGVFKKPAQLQQLEQ
ncbi:glycerophosphodiester phosphodiesterase [Ochromonadaceae sp. CCMP2298]|nr:glycerophosphodiester phosphodiesterase [Ochromonadaceae sp. CCMP2298]